MKHPFARLSLVAPVFGIILLASCSPSTDNTAAVTPAPLKLVDTIYVPGADDKLHAKKVSRPALDTQLKSGGNPAPALEEIIKTSPKWFPKGTHVQDVKDDGKVVTVLMSPEFADAKHWSQGEKTTELAIYSLVNTLAKDGKSVTFTIDGKPISTLGEFDTSDAIPANPDLNAAK